MKRINLFLFLLGIVIFLIGTALHIIAFEVYGIDWNKTLEHFKKTDPYIYKILNDTYYNEKEYNDSKSRIPRYDPNMSMYGGEFVYISKVIKVVDGDTIDLANGERIRLAIANTPERGQANYTEATKFTSDLCLHKNAKIDVDDRQEESYNRIVASVWCDGHYLNKELLDSGYATIFEKFCKVSEFSKELCF